MSDALNMLTHRIGSIIDRSIRPLFLEGGKAKITVMVRFEDGETFDVLVTDDSDAGIRAIVERRTRQESAT